MTVACLGTHTEEKVVGVWTRATDFEYLEQIEELAVDVTDNGHGSLDMDDIALFHEHLLGLCAYGLNDRLGEQLLVVEPLDALVDIDAGLQTSALVTRRILATTGALQGSPGMIAAAVLARKQVRWALIMA